MKVSLPIISICLMGLLWWPGCSSEEPPPLTQTKVVKAIKKRPQAPPATKEEAARPEPAGVEAAKAEPPKTEPKEKKAEPPKAPPVASKAQIQEKKEPEPKRAPAQEKTSLTQASTKTEKKAAVPEEVFYTVVKEDTLSSIAGKAEVYKDPLKWAILYRINVDALGSLKLSEKLPDMELPTGVKLRIVTPGEVQENLGKRAARMWVVNVLSATTNAEVVPAVINLAKNKYPLYITVAKVKEKDWMRVRVGYYKDRAEAEAEGKKIMAMLNFSDSWTTRLEHKEFAEFAGY